MEAINAPDLPGGLVLLGGAAAMPGLKELASEYFPGNIRVIVPEQMGIRHPGYATSLSLTMYEANLSDVTRLIKRTLHDEDLIASPSQSRSQVNRPVPTPKVAAAPQPTKSHVLANMRRRTQKPAQVPNEPTQKEETPTQTSAKKEKPSWRNFFSNFFD